MQEFKLPDLGEGMEEAEIRRWFIKSGDTVKLDQPMVEVETDKAVIEIPSPIAGTVTDVRVPAGKVAKLGEVLVVFALPAGGGTVYKPAPPTTPRRILAAPAVRKRAFELGIDLELVTPSQPGGRVTLEDVQAYAQRAIPIHILPEPALSQTNGAIQPLTPTEQKDSMLTAINSTTVEERQPLVGLRKRIAERMERSWRTVPHATAFDELDGTELVTLHQLLRPTTQQRGTRLTYMPLLIKLLIPVLKEFPIFNASLDEERREIIYKRAYHIGIAADSPEGLLVPVLRDANQLTLMQIAQQLEHLIEGAQKRTLSLSEVTGGTFTLNNVGSFGGSSGTPIINYPEVAILAVGRLQEKAIARNGTVIVRTMMPLALSFDHRLIDGAMAGKFLARFKELVEHPQQLMLDMV